MTVHTVINKSDDRTLCGVAVSPDLDVNVGRNATCKDCFDVSVTITENEKGES